MRATARAHTRPPTRAATTSHEGNSVKICCIAETLTSGVGRHVVDLTRELTRRRHEVHLLYSPRRADPYFVTQMRTALGDRCQPIVMERAPGVSDISVAWQIAVYVLRHGPFDIVHGHSAKGGGHA